MLEILCDASVVLKWFHAEGEEEAGESRALLDLHRSRRAALSVLDLTMYEVGNALVRGMRVPAARAQAVIEALDAICPRLPISTGELADALALAELPGQYLSAGQKRRLALARLQLCARPLWLLDEPLAALDAAGKKLVAETIAAHCASGGIVVAATHEPLGAECETLMLGGT